MAKIVKAKVFVAMSGGVDSSVAAALLKKQGYEVIGAHMRCFNVDGCGEKDAEDARRAAEALKIPFYVFDFEKEYKKKVVEYMVAGYKEGITPNPDVMCNKEIKFGLFLEKALEMGADYVATGHYVRLVIGNQRSVIKKGKNHIPVTDYRLLISKDLNKDQSYFLWTLSQRQLRHCLFPIGGYKKPEVRKLAKKIGLPNADKKDSQGVCFLGQITLKDFLGDYLPKKKGIVLNTAGDVVGEHEGAHFYTIGQRHAGIKYQVSGIRQKPFYVAEKDVEENAILVAPENDPALYQKEIKLKDVNFINPKLEIGNWKLEIPVYARVRYRQPLVKAVLVSSIKYQVSRKKNSKNLTPDTCNWKLIFAQPQKFVASGQSAVFYDKKGKMLGGGVIV